MSSAAARHTLAPRNAVSARAGHRRAYLGVGPERMIPNHASAL
jgi:hypothetical protein